MMVACCMLADLKRWSDGSTRHRKVQWRWGIAQQEPMNLPPRVWSTTSPEALRIQVDEFREAEASHLPTCRAERNHIAIRDALSLYPARPMCDLNTPKRDIQSKTVQNQVLQRPRTMYGRHVMHPKMRKQTMKRMGGCCGKNLMTRATK